MTSLHIKQKYFCSVSKHITNIESVLNTSTKWGLQQSHILFVLEIAQGHSFPDSTGNLHMTCSELLFPSSVSLIWKVCVSLRSWQLYVSPNLKNLWSFLGFH